MEMNAPKQAVNQIVMAGMRLMYDPKTLHIFKAGITREGPLDDVLAMQAAGLIKMIDDRAKGKLPRGSIAEAATLLLIEMAKFMTQAGLADPKEDDIRSAIEKLMKIILRLYPSGQQSGAPTPPSPQPGAMPPQQPPQQGAPADIMGA